MLPSNKSDWTDSSPCRLPSSLSKCYLSAIFTGWIHLKHSRDLGNVPFSVLGNIRYVSPAVFVFFRKQIIISNRVLSTTGDKWENIPDLPLFPDGRPVNFPPWRNLICSSLANVPSFHQDLGKIDFVLKRNPGDKQTNKSTNGHGLKCKLLCWGGLLLGLKNFICEQLEPNLLPSPHTSCEMTILLTLSLKKQFWEFLIYYTICLCQNETVHRFSFRPLCQLYSQNLETHLFSTRQTLNCSGTFYFYFSFIPFHINVQIVKINSPHVSIIPVFPPRWCVCLIYIIT